MLLFSGLVYYYYFEPTPPVPVEVVDKKEETYYYYVPPHVPGAASTPMPAAPTKKSAPAMSPDFDLSQAATSDTYKIFKSKDPMTELTQNMRLANPAMNQNPDYKYLAPINMVGEKLLDDPFRKLLGRAITGKLYYPAVARELHLRGKVSIGFVLHPDGSVTEAHIIKTSHQPSLDAAALDAVISASPIYNTDLYLKQAEYLVVNILF